MRNQVFILLSVDVDECIVNSGGCAQTVRTMIEYIIYMIE